MKIVKVCPKHGNLSDQKCFIRTEKRWGSEPKKSYSCGHCKKESSDKYRKKPEIREKLIDKSKKDRIKFKDGIAKTRKTWVEKNRKKVNETEKKRRYRNIDHTRNLQKQQQKKWRNILDDNYLKAQLSVKYKIKQKDVPSWMVKVKREIVKLRREIRKIKSGN